MLWIFQKPVSFPSVKLLCAYHAQGRGHERHNHPGCEEILYVISGKGHQVVESESEHIERNVGPGVLKHIPPGAYHSTINTGSKPIHLLAIYAPPGTEAKFREMEGVVIEVPKRYEIRKNTKFLP